MIEPILAVECPDFVMSDGVAVVVYFGVCNLRCKHCDFRKMMMMKDVKCINYNVLFDVMEKYLDFIDNVVVTGGEPLLFPDIVFEIVEFAKSNGKGVWLYTNLSNDISDLFGLVDRVVVDVKGVSVEDIMRNCSCDELLAECMLRNYMKYACNDKFVFRVPSFISDCWIDFRNIERYEVRRV